MKTHLCPKCGATMQEGYIAEKIPSRWVSGTPRRSLLQLLGLRR